MTYGVDWALVLMYLALVIIGFASIYSSVHSVEHGAMFSPGTRTGKQMIWFAVAFVIDILILFVINPNLWEVISTPGYLVMLGLLAAVIVLGVNIKGSHSWFAFGPIRFQPAEFSKITTSMMLATVMSQSSFKMDRPRDFWTVVLILLIPMVIIIGERETGSTLVYIGFLFVMYRQGLSGWIIVIAAMLVMVFIITMKNSPTAAMIVSGVAAILFYLMIRSSYPRSRQYAPVLYALAVFGICAALALSTDFIFEHVLQPHQRKRIEILLGLKEDLSGVGYNVHQSLISIGSGGFSGKGFLQGTQTALGFVPEHSTDFIFCNIGEEWGFIGAAGVIILFVAFIWRILYDAENSTYRFTRIYGYCVAACLFMHLMINLGMTMGIMPVIGIPLPLVSYGGSSLLSFSILIFIFLALLRNERRHSRNTII